MEPILVTAPYAEPLSLDDARAHCRVDSITEDSYIRGLVIAAREWAETYTQRQLISATYDLKLDAFPASRVLELPKPPLVSITYIKYYDSSEVEQTLSSSNYRTHALLYQGYIAFKNSVSLPSTYYREDAVTVRYVAGYGYQENVPETIKVAMRMMVGEWFKNREATVPGSIQEVPIGVYRLLDPYRVKGFI